MEVSDHVTMLLCHCQIPYRQTYHNTISGLGHWSHGCLLLGEVKGVNFIGQSKVAYGKFMAKLKTTGKSEKIFIEIV